ncbi:MAG: DUF1385 domain-containing protein [Anaerolineales bacterium]|nr:DUF1385 domain-containing protein [Anaerolineales bacterium]
MIEGVMMRGTRALAVAVRNPEGEIVVHTEPLDMRIYGGRVARMPFLRGLTLLWDALGLGVKSLMFSAEVALEEENKDASGEPAKVFEGPAQWGTVLFSLSFSVLLFIVFPAFVAGLAERWFEFAASRVVSNLIEGVVRLTLLIGYIWGISFIPDIKRLYGYHGAEHKTINAYEAGVRLTPQTVKRFPLEHPRCGTAFLLTVVIFSILLYTLLPPMGILARIASRLVLLPVIAGMGYEFLKFTAAHQDNALIRFITRPNLLLQRLTTREPDEGMLEVAIAALNHVLAYEHSQETVADDLIFLEVAPGSAAP